MLQLTVPVIQAFVDDARGGNPAGVVLNADRFDRTARQTIAAQIGLSETAFVSSSQVADFKLEFFTPVRQIAQCGHATIATFSYLAQQGMLNRTRSTMETVDGVRSIHLEGNQAFMEQRSPIFTRPDSLLADQNLRPILESLHLSPNDLLEGHQPMIVNTGNSFLLVPLRSAAAVRRVVPDRTAVERISQQLGLIGFYVFSPEAEKPGRDAGARMFAPYYGIPEEAATGMAAGPLACYLYAFCQAKKTTFRIEQGYWMASPSPSLLTARLQIEEAAITGLQVGGQASLSHSVDLFVDNLISYQ